MPLTPGLKPTMSISGSLTLEAANFKSFRLPNKSLKFRFFNTVFLGSMCSPEYIDYELIWMLLSTLMTESCDLLRIELSLFIFESTICFFLFDFVKLSNFNAGF